jgi:hypothetical protein
MGRNQVAELPQGTLQLKGYDHVPHFALGALADTQPQTPSEWFAKKFRLQLETFGPPILESVCLDQAGQKRVTPVSLNDDFFASILGGDAGLKHHVVFYVPEESWFFFDPRSNCFNPTTEQKLQILLSQYFIRCAKEMPRSVDIGPLFNDFRSDDALKRIVKRARSLRAADASFFSSESPHKRLHGAEVHTKITKQFVREAIRPTPGEVLPIDRCFSAFADYCRSKQLSTMARKQFKRTVAEVIKEEFDIGYRHDLQTEEHKYQRGWRGLTLSIPTAALPGRN